MEVIDFFSLLGTEYFLLASMLLFAVVIVAYGKYELSLAILFNGTLIYFYVLFKAGLTPYRSLTGFFYLILVASFIIPEIRASLKRKRPLSLNGIDVCFLLFWLIVLFNYLVISRGNQAAFEKISYAPFLAIAPYVGAKLLMTEQSLTRFWKYTLSVGVVLCTFAFYELIFVERHHSRTRFAMYMFEGLKPPNNPILFGSTFAILLLIVFVWLVEKRSWDMKRTTIAAMVLIPLVFLVLRSGSRGALLALAVAVALYSISLRRRSQLKRYGALVLVILSMFLFCYILLPRDVESFYSYSVSRKVVEDENSSVKMRIERWKIAFRDFYKNPITGVGIGKTAARGVPDNIILGVAAELGILGLVPLIALLAMTVRKLWSVAKDRNNPPELVAKIAFVIFLYSLCQSMYTHRYTNNIHLYFLMGLISSPALLNRYADQTKKEGWPKNSSEKRSSR